VEYVSGMSPTLKMFAEDASVEEMAIANWKADSIVEFLRQKLRA
jgi:hypothetical protein